MNKTQGDLNEITAASGQKREAAWLCF